MPRGSCTGATSGRCCRRNRPGPLSTSAAAPASSFAACWPTGTRAGIDVSPEQVALANEAGLGQVRQGDYLELLAERPGELAAVTATDLLEHLTKPEVLATFDAVARALRPGGRFVARVPNAVSPFGGHIRYGDFTHETWFTARSVRQLAAAAGFGPVGWSAARRRRTVRRARSGPLWKPVSGLFKLVLAAETGAVRGHIVTQNLTFAAVRPQDGSRRSPAAERRGPLSTHALAEQLQVARSALLKRHIGGAIARTACFNVAAAAAAALGGVIIARTVGRPYAVSTPPSPPGSACCSWWAR